MEKHQQLKNLTIFWPAGWRRCRLLFRFRQERCECVIEVALYRDSRNLLVYNSGCERLVRFRECNKPRKDVRVGRGWLRGAKLGDREGNRGHGLRMLMNDFGRKSRVGERRTGRHRTGLLFLIAMGRN